MKLRVLTLLFASVLFALSAFAAEVDGKWTGAVNTPNGDFPVTFNFMADGAKLTGSMVGMDGNNIAIKDGKIEGENIAFSVTLDFGGMPFTLNYKGVVAPGQIKLSGDAGGQTFEFTVKKAS